jgi:hypothetical protein
MWWQWFQPERERIAQKIALSAVWNEGYQTGYQVAFNQNRCDCGRIHRCCSDSVNTVDVKIDKQP